MSFVKDAMEFLKGGDEGKMKRFVKKYEKANTKQIGIREDEMSTIDEELDDLSEKSNDDRLSINLDLIKTVDDTTVYIDQYREIQVANIKRRKKLNDRKESLLKEIEMFKELNEQVK